MTEYEILQQASVILYNNRAEDLAEMVDIWAEHLMTDEDYDREIGCGDSYCHICGDIDDEDEDND